MKKVRMKVSIASPDWSYYPGLEVELEDSVADAWHEVGHCEIIEDISQINTEDTEIKETPKKRGGKNANKS